MSKSPRNRNASVSSDHLLAGLPRPVAVVVRRTTDEALREEYRRGVVDAVKAICPRCVKNRALKGQHLAGVQGGRPAKCLSWKAYALIGEG